MNEEEAFLQRILANPTDDTARLVYADWLEERNDARAEFLRVECEFASLPKEDERRARLKERLEELGASLDTRWLAAVSKSPIENCDLQFAYACPLQWDRLNATDDGSVRFCETCSKNVFFCPTIQEARRRASSGECVAVNSSLPRSEGDLEVRSRMLMGVLAPPRLPMRELLGGERPRERKDDLEFPEQ